MPPAGTVSLPRVDDQQLRDDGSKRYRILVQYAGPASYVTGGDPWGVSDVSLLLPTLGGITSLDDVLVSNPFTNGTNIFDVSYNYTNATLQFFDSSTKAEVGNGTNVSAYTGHIEVVCH